MIRHIVVFRWKPDTTDAQIAAVSEALAALPTAIPQIRRYEFGPDAGITPGGMDFGLVADFADADGYLSYAADPRHREVVDTLILPIAADIVRVQHRLAG